MHVAQVSTELIRLRTGILTRLFPHLWRPEITARDLHLIRLGTTYGGWWVPDRMLQPDSVCYSAGVGLDISFDLALISHYGCSVWGLDPTPTSVQWTTEQNVDSRFVHLPIGIAGQVGDLRFYVPRDPSHVSHSIKNIQHTTDYFTAECATVRVLMDRLGHDHLDLLKLDVEGAEHEIIESLGRDGIFPRILCVEFDQPDPLLSTRASIRKIKSYGYKLVKVDGFITTFVR